jgi:hypothetical protein
MRAEHRSSRKPADARLSFQTDGTLLRKIIRKGLAFFGVHGEPGLELGGKLPDNVRVVLVAVVVGEFARHGIGVGADFELAGVEHLAIELDGVGTLGRHESYGDAVGVLVVEGLIKRSLGVQVLHPFVVVH